MATKPVLVAAPALFTTQEANGSTQKKLKQRSIVGSSGKSESGIGIKRHVSQGSFPSTPNNVNGRRMRRDFSDLVGASAQTQR